MRIGIIVASLANAAVLIQGAATLDAAEITCSTSFQGYRVCQDSQGYRSTEWDRDGMRFGDDNQGDRWSTSRWRDTTITTITPPGR
jgi:hypothetical protein